jgi:hypothetical protein
VRGIEAKRKGGAADDRRGTLSLGAIAFAGGEVGLVLQQVLPERLTTGGPRDMIGAVVGLLTLLSALVFGLLIWTAYGVYSRQNIGVQTLAAKISIRQGADRLRTRR